MSHVEKRRAPSGTRVCDVDHSREGTCGDDALLVLGEVNELHRETMEKTAAAVGSNHVFTRLQFETSFSSIAAAASALSSVHTPQLPIRAEASTCMSIHPRPRPANCRFETKSRTSPCSASGTSGNAFNRLNNSPRLRRVPQASSPTTSRWQQTPPASSSVASRLFPRRRWSIHTDVSTRVIMLRTAVAGERVGASSRCRLKPPSDGRSPVLSVPPALAEPVLSFQSCRLMSPLCPVIRHRYSASFSYAL